jgi:hypothetical protein
MLLLYPGELYRLLGASSLIFNLERHQRKDSTRDSCKWTSLGKVMSTKPIKLSDECIKTINITGFLFNNLYKQNNDRFFIFFPMLRMEITQCVGFITDLK